MVNIIADVLMAIYSIIIIVCAPIIVISWLIKVENQPGKNIVKKILRNR